MDATQLVAVIEYAPLGELYGLVTRSRAKRFTEPQAKQFFRQFMTGKC